MAKDGDKRISAWGGWTARTTSLALILWWEVAEITSRSPIPSCSWTAGCISRSSLIMHRTSDLFRNVINSNLRRKCGCMSMAPLISLAGMFWRQGGIRTERGLVCDDSTRILNRGVQQGTIYVRVLQGRLFFIEPGHDIHWDVKIKDLITIRHRVDGHWPCSGP